MVYATFCGFSWAKEGCLVCHGPHFQAYECGACHRGMPNTARKDIAHTGLVSGKAAYFLLPGSPPIREGKELIKRAGCRRCHRIGGQGEARAANLDASARTKPLKALQKSLTTPVAFMPDFRFRNPQAEMVLGAVLAESRIARSLNGYLVVHFQAEGKLSDAFSKRCGGCHRLLSRAYGPLGEGNAGPNLSGLFGAFFPNDPALGAMTKKKLEKWLINPRSLKATALMPPVSLTQEELQEVYHALH